MVDENKILVDNALISTDIDRLIEIISSKPRTTVREIERQMHIGRYTIERWLEALEEEGYIRIEHKITDKDIVWLGEVAAAPKVEEHKQLEKQPITALENSDEEVRKHIDSIVEKLNENEQSLDDEYEEIEPEQRVDTISDDNSYILSEKKMVELDEPDGRDEQHNKSESKTAEKLIEKITAAEPQKKGKKDRVKRIISRYMDEINKQKAEIAALKQEKERIYRDGYLELESKMETDIAAISERILEKESKILELKERMLALPEKIEEAEKMMKVLGRSEYEGRGVLESTRTKIDKLLDELKKSESSISKKVEESRAVAEKARQKLHELEQLNLALGTRVETIKSKITETELQIDELNKAMRDMLNDLEETTQMKIEINDMEERLQLTLEKREAELERVAEELEELNKIEQWISEYVNDYERKISDIEDHVRVSESELDKLQELAEKEHLKKYLNSLEKLTKDYQNELDGIGSEQQSVERKIEEARAKMSELIRKSYDTIRRIDKEMDTTVDFEEMAGKAKNRSESIRKIAEEKKEARGRLKERLAKAKMKRKAGKDNKKKGKYNKKKM